MEFLGTAILSMAIIGTGFMTSTLTQDGALALLINAIATAAVLAIIIRMGAKISGAYYNPVVTIAMLFTKKITPVNALNYIGTQIIGAISGALFANAMFGAKIWEQSHVNRGSSQFFLSEIVATTGLVWIVLHFSKKSENVAVYVPLWIIGAYFFTSSTSFANPAITIGRNFTSSPSGISVDSDLRFAAAQIIGAFLALGIHKVMTAKN